jgi:hypothetical protein
MTDQITLPRVIDTTFWLHRPLRNALVLAHRLPKPKQSFRLIITASNHTGRTHTLKDIKLTSNKLAGIIETSKHADLKAVLTIPPFTPTMMAVILIQGDDVIVIVIPFKET